MRRLSLCVLVLLLVLDVRAADLAGVTLPSTVQVGEAKLVLNGMGLRKKFVVKVYVAGLYVTQKSSDANAILSSDEPKRVVMQFVREVSKKQLTEAFDEAFSNNTPEERNAVKADIDRFLAALLPVKEGDQIVFTCLPKTGTTFALNGYEKLTISTPAFAKVLLSVWLGPKPPNADLKRGMLGL